jgi:hypothetical protein
MLCASHGSNKTVAKFSFQREILVEFLKEQNTVLHVKKKEIIKK